MEKNTEKRIYNVIFVLIILIACNLRAPITGVGSLVNMIGDSLGLSSAAAGFITTIPLLAFAAVSPFAVIAARKLGAGNVMVISLLILNFGVIARSFLGNVGLFAGTALVGLAIGVANVLLPAIIKTYFPDKIPFMTSMYTAVMQIVSAVSTAISVPIAIKSDWKWALAIWIIMASIALVIWLPNRGIRISKESTDRRSNNVYKAPITRWVTIYMGVQSMIFYSFIAWLSPIMQHKGYEPVDAGYILSLYVIMGIIGSCMLPVLMKWNVSQSSTGIQLGVLYTVGLTGMLFGKSLIILMPAIALCGFCSGTCISFVMALFGLHTSNGEDASRLSGIAQSIGYLIAAVGPVLIGKLFDTTGDWTIPVTVLLIAAAALIFLGKIAGRDEVI